MTASDDRSAELQGTIASPSALPRLDSLESLGDLETKPANFLRNPGSPAQL